MESQIGQVARLGFEGSCKPSRKLGLYNPGDPEVLKQQTENPVPRV